MAVRTPLYWTGVGLRPMSGAQLNSIIDRAAYLYNQNPSVTLSVVDSNGNLDSMTDTRFQAGAATSRNDRFATEAETQDISVVSVVYDKIDQTVAAASGTVAPPDTSSRAFPLYLDASGDIRAMTQTDFFDTFITPASNYVASFDYFISSEAADFYDDAVRVSNTPVFIDTRANAAAYTAAGIAEVRDQPQVITNYYLFKTVYADNAIDQLPLFLRSDNDIQQYTNAGFDTILLAGIRHLIGRETGSGIRYNINGTGTNTSGTVMTDTVLNGTSAAGYTQRFVNADEYRTQEFPNGVPVTETTYILKFERV